MEEKTQNKIGILSGNMLKILACIFMLFDHTGYLIFPSYKFPQMAFLRIVGRLAFPIFCFFIAEGCYYTKNRKKHLLVISGFAVLMQAVLYLFSQDLSFSVFVIFAFSIALIYLLDGFIPLIYTKDELNTRQKTSAWLCLLGFLALSAGLFWGCEIHPVLKESFMANYGLIGIYTPVFAYIVKRFGGKFSLPISCAVIGACMVGLCIYTQSDTQYYSLLALPLLMLYSGKRGTKKLKYFFYFFYPLHMVALEGIYLLLKRGGFYRR